jgi:hypothetical protein
MANNLNSNPVYIDAAASSELSGISRILLIQWVEDAGDIGNDDDLVMVVNGVTITIKPQRHETPASVDGGGVVYEAAFSRPFVARDFSVTTIDHGALLVWLE